MHRSSRNLIAYVFIATGLVVVIGMQASLRAAGPLTAATVNLKWNYAISTHTATFLGNDQLATAQIEFKKSEVIGGALSIQSDAASIQLSSGHSPALVIPVAARPDGATTAIKLDGGDDPHLSINSVQSPRLQGKWIQLVHDESTAMMVELDNATFAIVHIDAAPGAGEAASDATAASSSTPPARDLLHDVTPTQLIASEKQLSTSIERPCPHCSGTGSVTDQVQVGEHKEGAWIVPDFQSVKHTCPMCNGKGTVRASNDVILRLSAAFLKNLAHLDQDNPAAQGAISQSYDMITNSMIGNFQTWAMLNQDGRSVLSRANPATGTPVIAQVKVIKCDQAQGGRKDFIAELVGTDQQVHIVNPVSADRLNSGFALMGGFTDAAAVEDGGSAKTPVIANGFLVAPPIEKTWYWWWDWRWNGRP